ncbi:hypothetical protein SAMN05216311_105117 [Chitinophaga sp. CF418]|nr:hypothetical protein SAMN05216311_105117 [Chitinophaga sp. CF418]
MDSPPQFIHENFQENFEPKRAFKSLDLKALVNFGRDGWTIVEPINNRFDRLSMVYTYRS